MSNEEYWAGDLEELLRLIEQGLPEDDELKQEWSTARNLILEGSELLAEHILKKLEDRCSTPAIWNTLVLVYFLIEREDSMRGAMKKSSEMDSEDLAGLILWGDLIRMSDTPKLHEGAYERAKQIHFDKEFPRKRLVKSYHEAGELDRAYAELVEFVEDIPESDWAWAHLGIVMVQMGDLKRAERDFRVYSKTHKHNFGLWYAYGNILAQRNKWDLAERAFRRAIEIDPNDPDARVYLGSVFRARGMKKTALSSYRKATQLAPEHFTAWTNIGMILMDMMREDEARMAFQRTQEISPDQFNDVVASVRSSLGGVGVL